ncbi:Gfo/Idh/MocA family oxidoreductase [Paenibacillus filicis]|uniref:Gfo/Idh/MocA family oxidoreductase n=1 Tax=Paenibacillus gyeongsangnamensis TaxID=3388067 RepID=A0ABT4QDP5_9BACL|nr:Gfo/Idh/MocA family oxidoreductase [Paenibacillus filicis]MCZ8515004.1 Gfo/Idh/MocA family oxidoreductase [Paenibacillus filicis]
MKTYAIVGAGSRCTSMFALPISKSFADVASIVSVYDPNHKRAQLLQQKCGGGFPVYDSFEQMVKEARPDVVIVTTIDRYHHEYIIKAMEMGCDVITEKPMTIDEDKCNAILEAEQRTGRNVTVTFNMRFRPFAARIKEIVQQKTIGQILSVHFEWFLDTNHGADYFRRWHRKKENSGGLLIHKSTHHFDFINWLLEEEPVEVSAFGTLRFYGQTREQRGVRCLTCSYQNSCEFYFDIAKDDATRELYLECESVDGYYRDQCVFSEDIDIEDSVSLNVRFSGGALMSYSLTAHSPFEGFKLAVNGSQGRIEAETFHGAVGPFAGEEINRLRIYNRNQEEITVKVPVVGGPHGGGDERLLKMLFRGHMSDPLHQQADSWDGAMSNAIGFAANKSMKEGKSILIKDLVKRPFQREI